MDNLIANVPNSVVAKETESFTDIGFNATNITIVYELGNSLKSWKPNRTINDFTGIIEGQGYVIIPKIAMDVTEYFLPPIPENAGNTLQQIPFSLNVPFDYMVSVMEGHTLTGGEVFTPVTEGAVPGCGCIIPLIGGDPGALPPDFSAFKTSTASETFALLTNGVEMMAAFIFDGVNYRVSLSTTNAAPSPIVPIELLWNNGRTNVTTVTNGIQGTTGTVDNGDYGNTARDSFFLDAGDDGYIEFKHTLTQSGGGTNGGIIGFNTTNAQTGYAGMEAAILISGLGLYKIDSGTLTDTGQAIVVGTTYRLQRTGSVLKMLKSSDGITFTEVLTYVFSSAAALYIVCDIPGTQKILFAKGFNLS